MKVKDLERTANVAWSPANQDAIYLAAGTAAQQLDASFNTNASLEIYSLNLSEPGMDMELKASLPSENRFHKIIWGPYGSADHNKGTIVAGCDGGIVQIFDADKLLRGENGLISKQDKHSGPVHSLDFNPFQSNLLATGASESEIYIWDMNNTKSPMTPGAKSQPFEEVISISWNRQVQHILASTFTSKCVVWDLRKNEPIIKLTDTVSRIRWKVVAWHPEVATQLCLASEEDQAPIIQLWDLRFATSPLSTMENHQRGVLSMAWCSQDSDLLISCGKDNRIICWNPNSNQPGGEVLSEVARTNQWNFDIQWCPKNPALIASPCFDGHVSVYSIMGGKTQQIVTSNKIADSFPGMEGYVQAPVSQQSTAPVSVDLSKPPKWLKKPVGARFGFGGKLITFEHDKAALAHAQQNSQPGQQPPRIVRSVTVCQVVSEPELMQKSTQLEQALEYGNFVEYCNNKAENAKDQHTKYIWHYLRANFEQSPRAELLNLLGYKIEDVNDRLKEHIVDDKTQNDIDGLNDQFSHLNKYEHLDGECGYSYRSSPDLMGDYNRIDSDPFLNISQQNAEVKEPVLNYKIKTDNDSDGLITQAILMGNVEAAVQLCLSAKKFADAIIIAMTGGPDLLARTQYKYFKECKGYVSSLISALVSEDWISVINNCDVYSWKEALTAALTHASDEDLPALCERMGDRLTEENNNDPKLLQDAQLCYICAGSFDKLVSSWSGNAKNSTRELQDLVELVTFLQKAVERQGRTVDVTGQLADLLSYYASLLASQGCLSTALNYLGNSQNEQVASLRDRLYVSLGQKPAYSRMSQPRKSSARQSFSSYTNQFGQVNPPNQFGQINPPNQFGGATQNTQTNYNQFNTGLPNAATNQPWQTQNVFNPLQPPQPFSPAPPAAPPVQPPRPTSVGSAHGGSGLPKNKYVLDPSVTTNQYSSRQYGMNPVAPLAPAVNPANFQTNALSNPAPNVYGALNPMQPAPMSTQPTPMVPLVPSLPQQNQSPFHSQSYGLPASENMDAGQSAMNYLPANAAPGWNDPPALNKPPRPQPKQEVPKQDPITHPIFGTAPVQPYPNNNSMLDGNQNVPFQPYGQQPQQQPPISGPPTFNTNPVNHNFNQNIMSQQVQGKPEKPVSIQKGPIPEEHLHMKTVLDELRAQCSNATNNLQLKRKIDDVSKKLESLYDMLRDHKLSANTLASLHQIVQLIQAGNYTGGLSVHTQLVSGPDFAQIASFMPGIKVLLQCALQLQIYLR